VLPDPYSSLNRRRTLRQTLEEPLRVYLRVSSKEINEKSDATTAEVGLPKKGLWTVIRTRHKSKAKLINFNFVVF